MNDIDVSVDERIHTFAASVRQHLDDLPEDELDDILGGLTGDLAEQAADNGGVLELGDPEAYADELRSAAGIPPRAEDAARPPLHERLAQRWRAAGERIHRNALGGWLLDLLVSLRPVWWVLRGFALYAALRVLAGIVMPYGYAPSEDLVPDTLVEGFTLAAIVVLSIQWGRGRWLPKNLLRHLRTAASIVAVIALPFAISSVLDRPVYVEQNSPPPGLLLDGTQVGNIFAYDDEGNLIERVQLYTDKGTPLNLFGDVGDEAGFGSSEGFFMSGDDGVVRVPRVDSKGGAVWNIYPLELGEVDLNSGELRDLPAEQEAPPFVRAPGLLAPTPTPGAVPPSSGPAETPRP